MTLGSMRSRRGGRGKPLGERSSMVNFVGEVTTSSRSSKSVPVVSNPRVESYAILKSIRS